METKKRSTLPAILLGKSHIKAKRERRNTKTVVITPVATILLARNHVLYI